MEFERGDKVVPIKKSVGTRNCGCWRIAQAKGQPYLFVTGTDMDRGLMVYACAEDLRPGIGGNYYLSDDLIPYVETNRGAVFLLKGY